MSETIQTPTGIIGVIHVPAIAGDPGGAGFRDATDHAVADCEALLEGGVETMIVENFGSTPFRKGWPQEPTEPHAIAALARIVDRCVERGAKVGVNCLRNDARAAIGIAAACGAAFIRVNVHVGAYVTDQGLIEGTAWQTLRYRTALAAEVAILADVRVKHARPIAEVPLLEEARDAVLRGMADGIVVTGTATGGVTDPASLEALAALGVPRFVGSGVTLENVADYRLADGIIVGTSTKVDGEVSNPIDPERVRRLVDAWAEAR